MDDANVKPNGWWELARVQFQEEMKKNSVAHRRDEATYRRHLFAFKKVILDFIYRSLDSMTLFNPIWKVEEVEHSGPVKDTQQEKP